MVEMSDEINRLNDLIKELEDIIEDLKRKNKNQAHTIREFWFQENPLNSGKKFTFSYSIDEQ